MSSTCAYKAQLTIPRGFNLRQTLNCGQCFRFTEPHENVFCGVALGRYLEFKINGDELLISCEQEFADNHIAHYLGFDEDYYSINLILADDPTLKKAIEYAGGIRILRQPAWETLCSFIISQNNNIKRISGIIERLCENFGEPLECGGYSFPEPDRLYNLSTDDLSPIRSGFRAKYILDAAKKVYSGEINFNEINSSDTDSAREMLMKIRGVGPKVADCVLLFGFHKLDAFPKDVWIKKVIQKYYPDGLPEFAQKYAGIAQQYLFHYERTAETTN